MHTLGGIIEYQQSWNLRTPGGGERTQAAPPQLTHNLPHTQASTVLDPKKVPKMG